MATEKKLSTLEKIASEFTLICFNNAKKDDDPDRRYVTLCPKCFSKTVHGEKDVTTLTCSCGHSFVTTYEEGTHRFIRPNFDGNPRFYLRHNLNEKNGKLRCFVHLAEMSAYKGHFRWRDVCYMTGLNLTTGQSYLFGPLYSKNQGNNRKCKAHKKQTNKLFISNPPIGSNIPKKVTPKCIRFTTPFSRHLLEAPCTTVNYMQRVTEDIIQKVVEIQHRAGKTVEVAYPELGSVRFCLRALIRHPSMPIVDQQLSYRMQHRAKIHFFTADTPQFFCKEYKSLYLNDSLNHVLLGNYLQHVFSYEEYEQIQARLIDPEREGDCLSWDFSYLEYPRIQSGDFLPRLQILFQTIFQHVRKNRREFLAPLLDPTVDVCDVIKFLAYLFTDEMKPITKTQVPTWKHFKTITDLYNYLKALNFIDERTAA